MDNDFENFPVQSNKSSISLLRSRCDTLRVLFFSTFHYVAGVADNRLSKLKSQSFHTMESCENEDRLSALPNQLKEVILEYFPIADAVRTSVLSSEWRYIWTGLSKLDFGWRFWFWEQETGVMAIALTQILLAHKGPVREFYIDPPFLVWDLHARFWLLNLSEKGVENVTITGLNSFKRGQGHLVIPSSVFECLQLKWLALIDCVFRPPLECRGFPNLVRLSLVRVYIESQLLRNLIRQCPLLETLIIFEYHLGAEVPMVVNSHSLKTLYLENISLGSVSLENVPNLTTVYLWGMPPYNPRGLRERLRAWEFMSYLIGIRELSFQFSLLEISDSDIIPKKLPELLGNLKTVDLRYMDACSVDQIAFMFCIISSSPNLQNLEMSYMYRYRRQFDKYSLRAVIASLEVKAKEEIKTSITTVTVSFKATDGEHIQAEMALIESLVSCCPALGKLVIKGSSSVRGHSKQQLSRALRLFGRSSSKLQIIYAR